MKEHETKNKSIRNNTKPETTTKKQNSMSIMPQHWQIQNRQKRRNILHPLWFNNRQQIPIYRRESLLVIM